MVITPSWEGRLVVRVRGEEVERRKKERDKWGGAQIGWSEVADRGLGEERKGKEE
jgi:hypothetical protein